MLFGSVGVAGSAVLASCSSTSSVNTAASGSAAAGAQTPGTGASGGPAGDSSSAPAGLAAVFDRNSFAIAGVPQRLAFGVAGADGTLTKDVPTVLEFRLTRGGQSIGPPITVERHADGVPIAYFPLRFTPDQPGTYQAAATINGKDLTAAFKVSARSDVPIPQVGDRLVGVDTPTTADHRGVEPICTRRPEICSMHAATLNEAMASGKPIAFLISTPQFCQIGVCGPVLELLVEQQAKRPGVAMVHAEVYTDTKAATTTPAVNAYQLNYEPALFVAKADGTIVDRLDNVFDRAEIATALDQATA